MHFLNIITIILVRKSRIPGGGGGGLGLNMQ